MPSLGRVCFATHYAMIAGALHLGQISISFALSAARSCCADLRRPHKYMLDIERIDHISNEMRAVVESDWPELGSRKTDALGRT
jgi:hypothetical protein